MPKLVVLDFDGTMTDAEAEGAPYRVGYLEDLAVLAGVPKDEVFALAERFEAEVAENPDAYGWEFDGRIVAPASVDPYLRVMPVARRILDHYGLFQVLAERTRLLDGILYKYNYTKTDIAFRTGARETLVALTGEPVHVVTNSHRDSVQKKIRSLGEQPGGGNALEWLANRVHGEARKYVLDPSFSSVPESLTLPGLSRPVLLRRRKYFEVLDQLRRDAKAEWSDVLVVGDIFELDLSLPLALGARVGLMLNRFTPAYEIDFVKAHPNGTLLQSLDPLPALVRGV